MLRASMLLFSFADVSILIFFALRFAEHIADY